MEKEEVRNILKQIRNLLIVIAILLFINVIILIVVNGESNSNNNETNTEEENNVEYDVSEFEQVEASNLFERVKEDGYHVVYIGRSTCGYCAQFIPIMKEAQQNLGFKTLYVDITEVIDFTKNEIIDQDSYNKYTSYNEDFGATPMVLVFKNGEYVDGTVGYTDLETYEEFLNNALKK